ncbi:hypothetical protein KFE25_010345 [Diacronema lutheri]|uniref:Ferredoxin n=1 Tax=Diacronema lutheri TaxID=2081491 RepID=A0A8J5XNM0_DIALT|nr:hypothetical protein KFE25_010345 [Diacronema lutheri]
MLVSAATVWCAALAALSPSSRSALAPPRALVVLAEGAPRTVEVCRSKHCTKRGSAKTLELLQSLAPPGVEVIVADCSDTEHGCFDECTMGPNVRIDGRIINGVKKPADCAALLNVDTPAELG